MSGLIDFHNHIIPGVDDGAQNAEESVAALRAMVNHGVTHVIVTPHFDGSLTLRTKSDEDHRETAEDRLRVLDAGWQRLQSIATEVPEITISRGAEVMLDVPGPDLSDARLHLAGGPFVLVEFPFMTVPPRSSRAIVHLRSVGLIPIIAHPERYNGMRAGSRLPENWRNAGAFLQLNGASLLGRYGKNAQALAEELLGRGLVDYMCSDFHARGSSPRVREYCAWMVEHDAGEQLTQLTQINPERMINGEPPVAVTPLRAPGGRWDRLIPWKR